MRTNFRPGVCKSCGSQVAAGEGILSSAPPWTVSCKKCQPPEEIKILATKEVNKAVFTISGFLGGDRFSAYRNATRGAQYDPTRRVNLAPFGKAIEIVSNLKASGFIVDVAPPLAASLQAFAAELKSGVEAATDRASAIDAELRSRGLNLFPFQKVGVRWLASKMAALLGDEMGLGKTIQTLIALPAKGGVIVICPAVAKGVWQREAAKWRPDLRVTVLSGRGSFRWPEPGEMIIINYDILPKEFVGDAPEGTSLIADEAHMLKGGLKVQRSVKFRNLSQKVFDQKGRVWLLTATPLLNRPQELWNLLQAANLARDAFTTWENFVAVMGGWEGDYGYEWGTPDPTLSAEALRKVSLRRMRTEVLPDLPTKTYRVIPVEIDGKTKKLCDSLEKMLGKVVSPTAWERLDLAKQALLDGQAAANDQVRNEVQPIAANIVKAQDIIESCDGLDFEQISRVRAALATAKIPALLELLEQYEEQSEPVIVFSAFRAPIDLLGKREGWATITGDTPTDQRRAHEDAFQAGKLKGIACTIKAGGVAITLTRAHQVIFVDKEPTPALNAQAEDRACRIGQTRGVVISQLRADHPLDERLETILTIKNAMIAASVDASRVTEDVEPAQLAQVDFDALAAEAEAERRRFEEALKASQERVRHFEEEKERAAEEKERVKRESRERILAETIHTPSGKPKNDVEPEVRHAETAREAWAAKALVLLAQLDPDRAQVQNQVGFNASDGSMGHGLARQVFFGLTNKQWALAAALCTKYWRQVGKPPV